MDAKLGKNPNIIVLKMLKSIFFMSIPKKRKISWKYSFIRSIMSNFARFIFLMYKNHKIF